LQQQIDLLDHQANKAIAVEEREIQELEQAKALETITFNSLSKGLAL
jgi:hypothetical protein